MTNCSPKIGLVEQEQTCSNGQPKQASLLPSAAQHVVQGFNNRQENPRPNWRLQFSLIAVLALVAVFVTVSAAALFACNSHFAGTQHLIPAEQQHLERLPLAMAQLSSRKLLQEARTDRIFARNIARQTRAQLAVKDSNELFADYFKARSLREDGPSHSYLRVNSHSVQ